MFGGARRVRTDDLYNAIVALSQLSYGPKTKPKARLCTDLMGNTIRALWVQAQN